MAHPNNNTQYIDKDFQYICLLTKSNKIMENLVTDLLPKFYAFDDYKYVLNTGLETEKFSEVEYLDFATIINKIGYFYSDYIDKKSISLINDNKLLYSFA